MNKFLFQFILILSIVLISCNENSTQIKEKVSEKNEYKIEAQEVSINIDSIISPGRILIIKNHLIILDFKGKNNIHLIDLNSNKYLNSFVRKGQGPSEIVTPWNLSKIDDDSFLVTDVTQKKVVAFSLTELINNNYNAFLEKNINQSGMSISVSLNKKSLYFIDGINGTKRLFRQNLDEDDISSAFGELISLKGENNKKELLKAQLSEAFMKNNKNDFVFAYKYYPLIELFDLNTRKWISITCPENFLPDYSVVEQEGSSYFAVNEDTKSTFIDLAITDTYIYALYSGENIMDSYYSKGSEIFVYDYKGNFIKKILLNQELVSFDVSDDSVIYGVNVDILPEIYKFDLTK